MNHIYYDPSNDAVYQSKLDGGWWCIVDGCEYGYWRSKAEAKAGMAVEQRRAEARNQKHAEANQ